MPSLLKDFCPFIVLNIRSVQVMAFYITFLLFALYFVDASENPTQNITIHTENEFNKNTVIESKLNYIFPKDGTMENIKESVTRFIHNIDDILNDINEEKFLFLENLENEKITKVFNMFHIQPCIGDDKFKDLKEAFTLRFSIYELPLRVAITELRDKVNEMKRSLDLEKSVLDLKLTACELTDSSGQCKETSIEHLPCLNDTCMSEKDNVSYVVFPRKSSKKSVSETRSRRLLSTECENGNFKCLNGMCINYNFVCDSSSDCSDNSDESPDCLGYAHCIGRRRCRNLNCIQENEICNGFDDCGDGTDEENCFTPENCTLESESFACPTGRCLPLESMCDQKLDCPDGADEGWRCNLTSGCERCAALGGACLRSPSGPLCLSDCPASFILDLPAGLCLPAESTPGKRVIYRNHSFFSLVNTIKVLVMRLSNRLHLLKRQLNQEMIKAIGELRKCMLKEHGVNGGLFEISF